MPKNWSGSGPDLHLEIDPGDGRRAGLERALRRAVRDGRLAPGTRLPSTRALAEELGLSRGTVTAAYDQLAAEGYLTARPSSGTVVADLSGRTVDAVTPAAAEAAPRHDLRPGLPDLTAFPARAWLRSTRRVLLEAPPAAIHGHSDPQGRIELRTALAAHLGRTRGVLATPDRIVITSGFYQSISLLAQVLKEGGTRTVAMEDPGHELYREVVRRAGPAVVPLPVDELGAQVDGCPAEAVVVTPAHQYPTGVPLHPRRRQALRDWARRSGGLIVEDDYDGEFRYDRRPVGALQGIAPDHVAYCGSASKALGPALRLGWTVLPRELVGPVVEAKSRADLYTETLGQLVLADLITGHDYDRHVRAARVKYRRRRELLIRRLGPGADLRGVPAGLHALLTLPDDGPGETEVLARCERRGIALRGLADLWHRPDGRMQGLLIGYAAPPEHAYPAALEALAEVLGTPSGRLAGG